MSGSRRATSLAAASGLVLGAAFLPLPAGWLAWGALVPLLLALEDRAAAGPRAAFRTGYAGGLAFFLVATHWIALLSDVATPVAWLKYLGWLLASGYLALYWGLAAMFAAWLARRSGVAVAWTFVPAMLLVEELRGSGEMGFPWFQPGYTQHALPALRLAALGSVTLVTGWVLALNAALARLWRTRRPAAAAVAAALLLAGLVPPALHGPVREAPGPLPRVALVQGNIAGEIKWSGDHQGEILAAFLALSDSAAARRDAGGRGPGLVIWPETATGSWLRRQLDQSIAVGEWAARHRTPVFTGFADYTYGADGKPRPWNAAGMWGADGAPFPEVYAKRHLVPFGERIPFQSLFPALGKLDLGQAEWAPGTRTVLFPGPAGPMSCLVCFESIFPDLARADVRAGARVLVNVTNDEWFGNSAALYEHAAMAPFRAVETGVPLLRCANTGLTEIIGPDGRVTARAPVFRPAVLAGGVPRGYRGTPYLALGDWPGLLAALSAAWLAARRWPWRWGRSPR